MTTVRLRDIPSVDRVLRGLHDTGLPHAIASHVIRQELQAMRRQKTVPSPAVIVERIRRTLSTLRAARLQPLLNGTGILAHTNFGRAPLGAAAVERLTTIAASYSNLEYSLPEGARSTRATYLECAIAVLCEAESAVVVNNNAAALVLLLRHFCRPEKNEVVISRGELIQIGGGFRVPEILEASGGRLREVGTTNRTSVTDYARAMCRRTAMVLRVHRSNFFMEGFVASASTTEIAAMAHRKRVPFIEDLGSGATFDTGTIPGLEPEPRPAALLRHGVDAVCFSGDKLFGGAQAGIIVGRSRLLAALKKEPLYRALRCDKLTLASLEATVDLHLAGGAGVPVVDMLRTELSALTTRAERIVQALRDLPIRVTVGTGRAQVGGGALPRSSVPSVTLDVRHPSLAPQELAARLRTGTTPVVGYIARGVVKLDMRTVFPQQDERLIAAIRAVSG